MRRRILIADGQQDRATEFGIRCGRFDADVRVEHHGRKAVEAADEWKPDLIIFDAAMRFGRRRLLREHARKSKPWHETRLIALATPQDHRHLSRAADLQLYSMRPTEPMWHRVEPVIEELLNIDAAPRRVLDDLLDAISATVQDDSADGSLQKTTSDHGNAKESWNLYLGRDAQLLPLLRQRLQEFDFDFVSAFDVNSDEPSQRNALPSMVLLDYEQEPNQGDYFVRQFARAAQRAPIALVVLSERYSPALERRLLNLGACRLLAKPLNFHEFYEECIRHCQPTRSPGRRPTSGTIKPPVQ